MNAAAKAIPTSDEYWRNAEQRGSIVMFFIICGHKVASLIALQQDPEAFWSVMWDANPPHMRRRLCMMLLRKQNPPENFDSAHCFHWCALSDIERHFVCTHTAAMARLCRTRLSLITEQAI